MQVILVERRQRSGFTAGSRTLSVPNGFMRQSTFREAGSSRMNCLNHFQSPRIRGKT